MFCWPWISVYLSQYLTNLMHKICFTISFFFMPLHVSSTCAHHQEVNIALHSLWYHHTYMCDDTRGCVMQYWPPDGEHMCSKHVEAWKKNLLWNKFCVSSWLNTEIKLPRLIFSSHSLTVRFNSLSFSIISFSCDPHILKRFVNVKVFISGK